MLWLLLWTSLILGALAGAFFLFRRLYRASRALVTELTRATEILSRAAEGASASRSPATASRVDLTDVLAARSHRDNMRTASRARRALRRELAYAKAFRRWRSMFR